MSDAVCQHENHEATVCVRRLLDSPGGSVISFAAEVRIVCAGCGEIFGFMGLPGGSHPVLPTCSIDAQEARLPIRPTGQFQH